MFRRPYAMVKGRIMNDILIKSVIEYLHSKHILSALGKDILDTYTVLLEQPFDLNKAKAKVLENNVKYPDLYHKINAMPTTTTKPMVQADEIDVRYNLSCQLELMCAKIPMN